MMLSAFNTKFKALKSRLPQSSLDSPWRMALFWMVATVVILAGFLLVLFWEALKAILSGYEPRNARNDELAIKHAIAAEIEETQFLHDNYKMNKFGTILGPKDPEW